MVFDRSALPTADFEFVVIGDTHYVRKGGRGTEEFKSRLKQTARAAAALRMAAALQPAFIIHLGDLVQEYPGSPEFEPALVEALGQIRRLHIAPRFVAGNHDVGDKPDPTMPAPPVHPRTLAYYHEQVGRSWYSFDHQGAHFVVLNSQVMNASLPEAALQRQWVEEDLARGPQRRIFMFLHLPPYLYDSHEPALGHYDNIAEPARGWLLALLRRYNVELLFAGHTHFAFFDRLGPTRLIVAPSPSFSRTGFPQLLTSGPPPEGGRDDRAKLGFLLVRVRPGHADVHLIRTERTPALRGGQRRAQRRLVTCTLAGLYDSPLGLTLQHPLATVGDVPLSWPSAVRERVRNDYPMMACQELGVGFLRVPAADLDDAFQKGRLAILRREGVRIVLAALWSDPAQTGATVRRHPDAADEWELIIPSSPRPAVECVRTIEDLSQASGVPIALSAFVPNVVLGKLHARMRVGFNVPELTALHDVLIAMGSRIARAICHVGAQESPWEAIRRARSLSPLSTIGALDFIVELTSLDDQQNADRAAEALVAAAAAPASRVYLSPMIDLDRTMDVRHGLLDPLCNPRAVFHVVRCLNTILFHARSRRFAPAASQPDDPRVRILACADLTVALVLVGTGRRRPPGRTLLHPQLPADAPATLYRLVDGTAEEMPLGTARRLLTDTTFSGPGLVTVRNPSGG